MNLLVLLLFHAVTYICIAVFGVCYVLLFHAVTYICIAVLGLLCFDDSMRHYLPYKSYMMAISSEGGCEEANSSGR